MNPNMIYLLIPSGNQIAFIYNNLNLDIDFGQVKMTLKYFLQYQNVCKTIEKKNTFRKKQKGIIPGNS